VADHRVGLIHLGPVQGLSYLAERAAVARTRCGVEGTLDAESRGQVDGDEIEKALRAWLKLLRRAAASLRRTRLGKTAPARPAPISSAIGV
jgi:hypothetical protein